MKALILELLQQVDSPRRPATDGFEATQVSGYHVCSLITAFARKLRENFAYTPTIIDGHTIVYPVFLRFGPRLDTR